MRFLKKAGGKKKRHKRRDTPIVSASLLSLSCKSFPTRTVQRFLSSAPHSLRRSPLASHRDNLSVRLLEARAGALTTELLGLAAAVVGDEESAVELDEGLLEEVLGVLVDELLVVGDEGLGNGLTDGVDLGSVTTA